MSYSITRSSTETFTVTHARYIASKVATDLMRYTRFYRNPSVEMIRKYEDELVALLKADYLKYVIYGYKRDGKWVEALRYDALPGGTLMNDHDPGKIRPGTDVPGESFGSYLVKNSRWNQLTQTEKDNFEATLPIPRTNSGEPQLEAGRWSHDHQYSAQGKGISRSMIVR